ERHTMTRQTPELLGEVRDLERGERNTLREHRALKRFARRVGIRLERQLDIVGAVRRRDGDPAKLADRDVVLLSKAKDVRVEPQSLLLVVDHDARQLDAHRYLLASVSWKRTLYASRK